MRSLAEASAAMQSEFRARQVESMETMRQMIDLISREKLATAHRYFVVSNFDLSIGAPKISINQFIFGTVIIIFLTVTQIGASNNFR